MEKRMLAVDTLTRGIIEVEAYCFVVQVWAAGKWNNFDVYPTRECAEVAFNWIGDEDTEKRIEFFT